MSDPYECKHECKHSSYCEHTEEYYCNVDDSPIFMAHRKFYNAETGECSEKEPN